MQNRIWTVLATVLLLVIPVRAQFNSALQGVVQDPSKAAIVGATVKLTNTQTGVKQETKTSEAGFYHFANLAPGEYEITIEAQGFQVKTVKASLTTRQNLEVNFDLELKTAQDTVQVTAEAPILNTAETRQELTLKQSKMRDMPLLNNSIFALLSLAPGVVGTNSADDNFNPEYFSGMSANGRSFEGNTFNVDGLNVTSNITNGTSNLGLNPEAVQEVTIETNTFKAEQGLGSSIVVSVATKSGTNEYHGSANYWFTDQDMRARTSLPFVASLAPFARQNLSGGFGGPIIKNKTFFFGAVEMLRSKNSTTSTENYEAPEFVTWAQQNFPSTVGTRLLTDVPIQGPVTTKVLQTASDVLGSTNCGTTATANIPCSLPMVVQGTWNRSPYRNGLQWNIRGDQNLRDGKDRIYGSFVRTNSDNADINIRPILSGVSERKVNAYQVSWVHTFNPSLLNEFGFSVNKVEGTDGIGKPFHIPSIGVQSTQGMGIGGGGTFVQHNYNWRDVVTWVKSSHTLKLGGTFYTGDDYALFEPSNSRPNFSFLNLLDLVRDQPFSGSLGAYDPLTGEQKAYEFGASLNTASAFVQDEWKVRPNLNLTLSLRWDDFGNPSAIKSPVKDWKYTNLFVAPGTTVDEIIPAATIRQVDHPFNGRLNKNFSPRFGFAWSPGSSRKTSIRGGIGLYNDWVTLGETVDRMNINPPNFLIPRFGVNVPLTPIPPLQLGTSDVYPYGFNLPTLPAASLDARGGIVGLQSAVGGVDPNLTAPKVLNFLVGVEREIKGRTVVGISYSGSRGWDEIIGTDYNRIAGDLLDGRLDRLNPSFGTITYVTNFDKSNYNAMIASIRTDLGQRGLVQASYTLGHATDLYEGGSRSVGFESAADPRQLGDRQADAPFDVRHRFSASGVYRLPTPFRNLRLAKGLLGGWEIGSTAIVQSGTPFTVINTAAFNPIRDTNGNVIGLNPLSGDYNADGFNYDFPNQAPNLPRIFSRGNFLGANSGKAVYTLDQFSTPAIGTEGNAQRSYFRQQGFIGINASVIKNNRLPFLGEGGNLQLKFEFFNVINRVNLGGVNGNVASPTFGEILGQGDPRVVQIGARISF
ncbi:MAG: carboxypeptidase regulatory-like domain-containing protein [Blastocatellia bacterium]|nr:carboxypeptidase regulatory-like domain-containing protein [Blastocatellia bacterium]